jgi:O-antigen/teichoic acid export membrane protein
VRGPAKHLTKGVAIYGAGDAIMQVVNFGLLYVYVHYDLLTLADYGALAVLLSVEAFAKVINRWGLDGAFMRFYHDREEGTARRQMASTILWFLVAANGAMLAVALAASGWLAPLVKLAPSYLTAFRLMFVNIFLISFTFFPFHIMRLQNASLAYSGFTFARTVGTTALRIVLVVGLRMDITGWYLSDLLVTLVLLPLLWRWFRPLAAMMFSSADLKQALRFGLPRLPHGLAQQYLENGPKLMLGQQVSEAALGVYQNGTTLGTAVRFFTSAFETAWAPFYYATSRQPDAKQIFGKMATYGVAVLVLLVAGTAAVARDVILLILNSRYLQALPVVPIVAVAMALQGVYLLTSIGLNLTKRTEFYPASTLTAASVGFVAGLWLIPTYGVAGAAVTVLVSYLTQLVVAFTFAQRFYPITYEVGRLLRLILAGSVAAVVGLRGIPMMPPIAGLLVRGTTVVLLYGGLLWATGFFRPTERAFLREMIGRLRRRTSGPRTPPSDDL